MVDEWEAECLEADLSPGAAPDLPNDWSGASVSATPRDAIKAAAYILCIIGHVLSYATKHTFQRTLTQTLCADQIHPLGFQNHSEISYLVAFCVLKRR